MKKILVKEYKGVALELHNLDNRKFCGEEIGRTDMNGRMIREGDIVLIDGKLDWGGVVVYNPKGCGFCFEDQVGEYDGYAFAHGWGEAQESDPEDDWEVAGSIYGNK